MANRILLGTRGSDKGLFIGAKYDAAGNAVNVVSCNPYDLLYDSRSMRNATVYRGGNQGSISNSGLTYTDSNHPDLGYIPFTVIVEDYMGKQSDSIGSDYAAIDNISNWVITSTAIIPASIQISADALGTSTRPFRSGARVSSGIGIKDASNIKFMANTIPLQYGRMNNTSNKGDGFWN